MSKGETSISEERQRRSSWPDRIDRCLNWFKWPAASISAIATPLLAWSLIRLLGRVLTGPFVLIPFILGCVVFVMIWRRWLSQSRIGRFMITLEHEATHALFAMLTLHRIVGFRASLGRGGEVRFTGRGNWLISVAPYFFPSLALLLFLVAYLLPFPGLPWQSFLLGIALGYHIVSTIRETHRDQTDLKDLGLTFCFLFLPAANLAVIGLLISYAHAGSEGTHLWLQSAWEPIEFLVQWFKSSLQGRLESQDMALVPSEVHSSVPVQMGVSLCWQVRLPVFRAPRQQSRLLNRLGAVLGRIVKRLLAIEATPRL
jgi:hypothetical protein